MSPKQDSRPAIDIVSRRCEMAAWPLIIVVAVLVSVTGAGCNSLEMKADWAAGSIEVDGSASDWDEMHTAYFEDQKAVVGIASDSSHLYLLFRTREPRSASMITMTGLTLWLTAEADQAEELMIRYRGGPSRGDLSTLLGPDSEPVPPYPNREAPRGKLDRKPALTIAIKDRVLEKSIATDGSDGPTAAYALSDDMFTWEFAIPLEASRVRYYGLGIGPGGEVKTKVVWGEFDRSSMPKPPGGMGGDMGGGPPGGGRKGGGMGGGAPRGGGMGGHGTGARGMMDNMPQKQEVQFKLSLAIPDS